MDISINARVKGTDGDCGQITCVIFNPITDEMSHIVVKEDAFPYEERSVPAKYIQQADPNVVNLNCTIEEFSAMETYMKHEYLELDKSYGTYTPGHYAFLPFLSPVEDDYVDIEHESIPAGELSIRRGAEVNAVNGHIGKVDEFLVEPTKSQITHIIVKEGHLWNQKDVTIPVSKIDHVDDNVVYLKIDKSSIANLPTIPVRHHS